MSDLDPKALEAAQRATYAHTSGSLLEQQITAYLAALPSLASVEQGWQDMGSGPISMSALPQPDTLVQLPNGFVTALMFYYATEGDDLRIIARDQGFDFIGGSNDGGEDLPDDVRAAWEHDGSLHNWHPEPPDGWQIAGKWDSEDGPCAFFIRPSATPTPGGTNAS